MIIWGDIPNLAQWPLTMTTEERNKGTELVPTGLQLTPLLQVFVLHTTLVKQLLGSHITVFHTEAALVHTPERKSGDRVVQTCGHLGTHILPTGTDVTTPGSSREALLTSKAATRQQEDARLIELAIIHTALTIIDGIGINRTVGVEIFSRSTERRRTTQGFTIPHRSTVAHVGLRGIHPPGVNTGYTTMVKFGIEILVHLTPEHLTGSSIVGVIETILIARAYPVVDIVGRRLNVHPSLGIKLFVVVGVTIELGPNGDHETSMHGVNAVEHCLGVWIARSLKLVTTPLVLGPVVPVLHDVVDGYMTLAELCEGLLDLARGLIAFATLPEAQHPLRVKRCLTRQCTVT